MSGSVIHASGPSLTEREAAATMRVAEGLGRALGVPVRPCETPARGTRGAADRLLREARADRARLLVVVGGPHGAFGTALLGSLAHTLVRRAPCPVVVLPRPAVAGVADPAGPWSEATSLVCGIDRSPASMGIARTAASLAAGFGDELVLLHTLRDEAGLGIDASAPAEAHVERTVLSVGGRGYVQAVQPVLGLCSLAARCDARLLVVGARRLGRLSLLLGRSVSTRLAAVADRPVVLVPDAVAHLGAPSVVP